MMLDYGKYKNHRAAIDEYGMSVTYGMLDTEGKKITDFINGRCLVFLLCKNTIGSILGYVAFMGAGIVPALLSSSMDQEMIRKLVTVYQPSYLWVPQEQTGQFIDMESVYCAYQYCLLRTRFTGGYPMFPELGLLLTTSGSTGSPKFVRQSYSNIEANAKSIAQYLELDETERPITTLPMNYTYGLSIINSHFLVGATLLVTEKSMAQKEFWKFFKEAGATSFGGVPYTYEMLDCMHFERMELQSLRTMTQAGGKLTPKLHQKFAEYAEKNGKKFVVMYGQCEATARMGYLPAKQASSKCGSMGIAIPGGKFRLLDGNGQEIMQAYKTGELVYEGINVTLGYAERAEDLAKGDERNGVLLTGDMAMFDEDGYYYIVGRKKRFLKVYGNRVNLDEIDRMLKRQFENADFVSSGVDDHMDIYVTESSVAKKVKEFVVSKTKLNTAAFRVFIIDEIPRNESGKILYKELEKCRIGEV